MSAAGKTFTRWFAAAALIVGVAVAAFYLFGQRDPGIPPFDSSEMEPQVGEQLRRYGVAVRANPDSAQAWARLAQAFHAHELYPQAIDAYGSVMELQPQDSRWPYLAALAQAKSDPLASLPLFKRAIALQPSNAAVYLNLGDILFRLGRHDEAEEAYETALSMDPESSFALYGLAQLALVANDPAAAAALLERAAVVSPGRGEISSLLAQAYQRLGREAEARRQSMIAGAWPDATRAPDPVAQAMLARAVDSKSIGRKAALLANRGKYDEAEAMFRQVLEIRPGNARDYANLGGVLAGQGRAKEALAAYKKGLEIDPADVDLLNNLGYTLLQLKRHDEAEGYLNTALERDPGFAAALGNLGLLAEQRQQPKLAIAYYQQALEQNPGLLRARYALATQLAVAGDTAAAVEQWRTVLEINPNELAAVHDLAVTEAARGEHTEAIRYLRQGLAIAPNSSRLVAALAWQLATAPQDELRDGAEAMLLAQRVFSAFPKQPQIIDITAAALAESGDFDNAVTLMERIASADDAEPYAMRLKAYRQGTPWRQPPSEGIKASSLLGGR